MRAAKAGPDYIDPAFHAAVTGSPSVNLDSWAMSDKLLDALAAQAADGADIVVIEGVMGLFDGAADAGAHGRHGATADLAAHFGLPVVLVLDVARQAQSAAAIGAGFLFARSGRPHRRRHPQSRRQRAPPRAGRRRHRPARRSDPRRAAARGRARFAGAPSRTRSSRRACRPRRPDRSPRRHRRALFRSRCHCRSRRRCSTSRRPRMDALALPPPGQRIALARDQAFSFVYPHVIDAWRRAGAEILPFSPLADEAAAATTPTVAGCRAAIRNCTPTRSPPREISPPA